MSAPRRLLCWRCRRMRADIRDAACPACRKVLHACYDATGSIARGLLLAALFR